MVQQYDENSNEETVWKREYNESYAAYLQPVPMMSHPLHQVLYPKCKLGMIFLVDDGLEGTSSSDPELMTGPLM